MATKPRSGGLKVLVADFFLRLPLQKRRIVRKLFKSLDFFCDIINSQIRLASHCFPIQRAGRQNFMHMLARPLIN